METQLKLNSYQEAILRFLRNQVDSFEYQTSRPDAHPHLTHALHIARQQLKTFVEGLRKDGFNI